MMQQQKKVDVIYLERANVEFIAEHILHHSTESNKHVRLNPFMSRCIENRNLSITDKNIEKP